VRYRTRKFISFIGYISAILILSIVFSDRLGGLTVAFGVAGAGIAFALQEVIARFTGWYAISFAHFYKTGDRVQLGGIKGDVIYIGILRTTLMEIGDWVNGDLYNSHVARIANSFVFKEPVLNHSGDFPFLWDEIKIPVRYGSDYNQARVIFQKVAESVCGDYVEVAQKAWKQLVSKFLIENASVQPMVSATFDENWVTYTIRYVVDHKKRRSTKDLLYMDILQGLEQAADRVRIASTASEITLVETPEFDVNVQSQNKDLR